MKDAFMECMYIDSDVETMDGIIKIIDEEMATNNGFFAKREHIKDRIGQMEVFADRETDKELASDFSSLMFGITARPMKVRANIYEKQCKNVVAKFLSESLSKADLLTTLQELK